VRVSYEERRYDNLLTRADSTGRKNSTRVADQLREAECELVGKHGVPKNVRSRRILTL
jgi:hypothetical protein